MKDWEDYFWPHVQKEEIGCWFWRGCLNKRGYPQFHFSSVGVVDAGRFLWQQINGPISNGFVITRICKARACVNPQHMLVVLRKDLPKEPAIERFSSKINKTDGCWFWIGRISPLKYGMFFFNGRDQGAHRVAWQLFKGLISKDMDVCHTCDIPHCVRPDHLFLGTAQQNIVDCMKKGRARHPKGEEAGKAKLTAEQVLEIRRLYNPETMGYTQLSRMFGVTPTSIMAVVRRTNWRHI